MLDTLEKAQKEGRAPWTTLEIDTKDFAVYNDIYPVTKDIHLLFLKRIL